MENNTNPGEGAKKPRKPRIPKPVNTTTTTTTTTNTNTTNTDSNAATNIDSSKIDSIHNQINTQTATSTTIVKKPRAPRTKKESPLTSLDSIITHFEPDESTVTPPPGKPQPHPSLEINQSNEIGTITKLPYQTPITHIYHLSDIHIQLYKRHQEYREVFQRVYDYLTAEKRAASIDVAKNLEIPFIVVITGDILHSKADLSPECIQLTYSFIKMLSSIMPVVLIAGNHDININNRDRLDSLTPILADLPTTKPVYYLLETGIYQLGNVLFYHSSILDSKVTIQPRQSAIPNVVHIGLYHGRVNGAVYFNGIECQEPITAGNKTITPTAFAEYDVALLGDIHKHQFLTPNIAYAGSLIQQNIGENVTNHGLIKWSLASHTGQHVTIPNDWSYVNIHVDNKKANYLCTTPDGGHQPNCTLTKNISMRILYKNTPESYLADYITLMKMNHNIADYRWNYDDDIAQPLLESTNTTTSAENMSLAEPVTAPAKMKSSLVDITNPEIQFTYLTDIIRNNTPDISPTDIALIKSINIEQNRQLRETNKQFNTNVFSGHYKILRLEFSNLFSFGESNVIQFKEFQGIVGIIAPNHLGKSSILDIIVYTLFDEFTRKGSTKDIININRDEFSIKMDLQIAEWIYTIQKSGQRTKIGASVQVRFSRKHSQTGVIERLEEDNAAKTKERIMEYFGCYEDMIHTSFSIQNDNACFIDSTNIKRKDELERIMRIEIVKKLYEQVNQRYNKDRAVMEHIRKKVNGDDIIKLKKDKTRLKRLLEIIQVDREYAKARIREINHTILNTSNTLHKECDEFLKENDEAETQDLLASLEEELLENENQLEELNSSITNQDLTTLESLKARETELAILLAETNKKIRQLDQSLEKLYKSRKPINTKQPVTNSSPSSQSHQTQPVPLLEYLTGLKATSLADLTKLDGVQQEVSQKLASLRTQELRIQDIQTAILSLEKKKTKLPPAMQALLDGISNPDELEQVYMDNLECFIDFVICQVRSASKPNQVPEPLDFVNTPEYKEYSIVAKQYYLYHALHQTHYHQTDQTLASQASQAPQNHESSIRTRQQELENELSVIKVSLADVSKLEVQKEKIITKQVTLRNQIKLLETDIANTEGNAKIDEEIILIRSRRVKYEGRIQTTETELQHIKCVITTLAKIAKLELEGRRLALDIKEAATILAEFEKYRAQIEENKPILAQIAIFNAELHEFEEVLELVEKRQHTEEAALMRASTTLEQMKREIDEARELEAKLRLQDIYRSALKELPYILLGKIQPMLEKKVNDLLAITTDFSVRFDMSDNKIDIYLDRAIYTDKSRAILINNASGFERFMASLAIRLALLELSNLPKINFIAIDEGWSSFDTHNINNVSLILDYLTSKFEFVLTISHLIQIKEHCDIQISLRRDERGFSKIIY